MMHYSVVVPTNRSFVHSKPLWISLRSQTFLPDQIVIVLDQYLSPSELDEYCAQVDDCFTGTSVQRDYIHPSLDSHFVIGQGASYVRNYGRQKVTSPYMMFIDDDNIFDEDFMEKILERWKDLPTGRQGEKRQRWKNSIIVPIQYDDTNTYVRQAVADSFSFVLCRPHRLTQELVNHTDRYYPLFLSSSNCLVGPTDVFTKFPFREDVPFVYEDLMMTGQMSTHEITLLCDTRSSLIHIHHKRGKLAELYINTPQRAYYKAKHRIFFVHMIGSCYEKILFYCFGFWGQGGRLVLHIMIYAPIGEWFGLFGGLWRGTVDGLKSIKVIRFIRS